MGSVQNNQDLLRATFLDPGSVQDALNWIRETGEYPNPKSIHLNLTLRCTGHCLHCKQWTWPPNDELNLAELEQLYNTFNSWGVQTITFGGGNPLLHKNIALALKMAQEHGFKIGIITEGVNMSNMLVERINESVNWIRFSLDGPNADVHDKIRNTPGLFNTVMQCLQTLKNRNPELKVGLNCVIQKENFRSLSPMMEIREKMEVDVLMYKLAHGEDTNNKFLLSETQWKYFISWIGVNHRIPQASKTNLSELKALIDYKVSKENALIGRPIHNFYLDNQIKCYAPLFFLTCDSRGNMYPCDYLQADTRTWDKFGQLRQEFLLGNVLESPELVLEQAALLFKTRLHDLPRSGYSECGCCTRFCQFNTLMTEIDNNLIQQNNISFEELKPLIQLESHQGLSSKSSGFL